MLCDKQQYPHERRWRWTTAHEPRKQMNLSQCLDAINPNSVKQICMHWYCSIRNKEKYLPQNPALHCISDALQLNPPPRHPGPRCWSTAARTHSCLCWMQSLAAKPSSRFCLCFQVIPVPTHSTTRTIRHQRNDASTARNIQTPYGPLIYM
jgi:hypothetical protein